MWALSMFDSSSKISSGYLAGKLWDFGAFDECINVQETVSNDEIHGKYCLISLRLGLDQFEYYKKSINKLLGRLSEVIQLQFESDSYEKQIKLLKEQTILPLFHLDSLIFSMCVPSECTENDINANLEATFESNSIFAVIENSCTSVNDKTFKVSIWYWIILGIFYFYIIFLIIVSIIDVYLDLKGDENSRKKGIFATLLCFSVVTNYKRLLDTKIKKYEISSLNGIRFLSIFWIILGHRSVFDFTLVYSNSFDAWKFKEIFMAQLIFSARLAVDTFLVLTGCLLMYGFLNSRSMGLDFNIPLMYFLRIVRLTPPVAVLIILDIFIFPYIGSGPLWKFYFSRDPCVDKWWETLFYVNNYDYGDGLWKCLPHTWFLAVDTQLYVLSPIILVIIWKWPRSAFYILSVLILVEIAIPLEIAVRKHQLMSGDMTELFGRDYIQTQTRAGSWVVGLCLGLILFKYQDKDVHIKSVFVFIGWFSSITMSLFIIFIGYITVQPNYVYDLLFNSIFIGFYRIVWSLIILWIVFACEKGYGGIVNIILSSVTFRILARLVYSMYLLSFVIQMFIFISNTQTEYITTSNVLHRFFGDITMTLILSVPWTLAFESPFQAIVSERIKKYTVNKTKKQDSWKETENLSHTLTNSVVYSHNKNNNELNNENLEN